MKKKNEILRPTLPYALSMSHKVDEQDPNKNKNWCFKDFCVYIRLTNCSTKRFIKNIEYDDAFDGAEFVRAWQFDSNKPFAVIENVSITVNKSLNQKVNYPYNSSYADLFKKLESFKLDGKIIAQLILNFLKNETLQEEINKSLETFLAIFTYHLFFTEVQRHPGAAIHHAMALDLISAEPNLSKDWEWVKNNLPMGIENACEVVRFLQTTLSKYVDKPYYYNIQGKSSEENDKINDFLEREKSITTEWLKLNKLKDVNVNISNLYQNKKNLEMYFTNFYGI